MQQSTLLQFVIATLAVGFCSQQVHAYVQLPQLTSWASGSTPPVTNWLLSSNIPSGQQLAWRKLGAKLWTFMSQLDHDFVNPTTGITVHPSFPGATRVFGPTVTCGRFARQFVRMPFHDCGTYDVGNTGSVGSTSGPRFGCNGSLRKEVGPCLDPRPTACVNGVEARFDLATGAFLNETVFASVEQRYGRAFVDWAQDPLFPRPENFGFGMALAYFYQLMYETRYTEPSSTRLTTLTMADLITYAGFLATAKCGGPQIVFQTGRPDAAVRDPFNRLPAPVDSISRSLSYFWTGGLTNMDVVVLTTSHSLACFAAGCLDSTPSVFDLGWAQNVASVTNMSDPRLCQFTPTGPIPSPSGSCILIPDAQINARPETQAYLRAILSQVPISSVAGAYPPTCTRQAGAPACPTQPYIPQWQPFKLLDVNLCNSWNAVGCPKATAQAQRLNNMFATSYFKMTKMYGVSGVNSGWFYGVQTQPCQPGTIRVGGVPGQEGISTRCTCCPQPPAQTFGQAAAVSDAALSAVETSNPDVVTEAGITPGHAAAAAVDVTHAPAVTTEPTTSAVAAVPVEDVAMPLAAEEYIDPVAAKEAIRVRTAAWAAVYLGQP